MTINEYLNKHYKKIIGWGTGGYFKKVYKELNIDLTYLIDSDESKTGQILEGYTIFSPSVLQQEEPNDVLIVIFSSFQIVSSIVRNFPSRPHWTKLLCAWLRYAEEYLS